MDASLLFSLLALLVTFLVAAYLEKKQGIALESRLWWLIALAALIGRVVFVWQFWPQYQADWLSLLNIRDGGFNWQAALLVLVVGLAIWGWRQPASRTGLALSVGAGALSFGIAFALLMGLKPTTLVQLPTVVLRNLQHEPVALTQFKGKPVVLNLWASWCPPCRREMPVMQAAQQQHDEVHFVFANQAETSDVIQHYLQTENLQLDHVLLDTHTELAQWVKSRGLPTTLFIDAEGNMQSYRMGELSAASLASHLQALQSSKAETAH